MSPKPSKIKPILFQCDLDESIFQTYLEDDTLSVDCEMMGLNPRRDRLCVVQMCDTRNNFSLVQIVPGQTEAPRLKALLENPAITKIFHYARMDLCSLKSWLGIRVNPIFCTKIASKLSRTYSDRHGLRELIREFFGENMDKKNQSSDWGKKNLNFDQIEYACEDVRYLATLQSILSEMLEREGRLELAEECFRFIPTMVELDLLEMTGILEH
ncbi:MAG: ribonuclease D [Leptospiraceae bacterium]|nr:ribonuclease D [Leptospiraceae bacterium]MCP5500936.1 ribonuclease D [Leptospiraceae bacterium]